MTSPTPDHHPAESHDATLSKSDDNLVWIDCEMTGLDPEKERLLEIAVVVTGPHLTPRVEGPVCVIHQSDELLNKMDAWNKGTHGRSGLIDKVKLPPRRSKTLKNRFWHSSKSTCQKMRRLFAATPSAKTADF